MTEPGDAQDELDFTPLSFVDVQGENIWTLDESTQCRVISPVTEGEVRPAHVALLLRVLPLDNTEGLPVSQLYLALPAEIAHLMANMIAVSAAACDATNAEPEQEPGG